MYNFRVMVLNGVVSFLLFLAQVVIVLGMGALSYFFFAGRLTAEGGINALKEAKKAPTNMVAL